MKKRGAALLFCLLLVLLSSSDRDPRDLHPTIRRQREMCIRESGGGQRTASDGRHHAVLVRRLSLCTGVGVHRL